MRSRMETMILLLLIDWFSLVFSRPSERLMKHLLREGYQFTVINSSGGVTQEAVIGLLVGFTSQRMPALLEIVELSVLPKFIPTQRCFRRKREVSLLEAQVGGALVYDECGSVCTNLARQI